MGDHINGPSKFVVSDDLTWLKQDQFISENNGALMNLSDLVSLDPREFLGENYGQKYPHAGTGLAFLFKVLSVRTALSIQAHPDRETA